MLTFLALGIAVALLPTGHAAQLVRARAAARGGGIDAPAAHGAPSRRPASAEGRRRTLVVAVRLLASELAAGARPSAALEAAATADPYRRDAFRAAAVAETGGGGVAAVLRRHPELAFVGHAWSIAAATGSPPAELLSRAADDCADREDQRRAVAAGLAGARASAALLAALPLLGVLLGSAMGARPIATLFGTTAGRLCLVAGGALDALGLAWTAAIARRAVRA